MGKPIIAYSIEAALNSELFEEVMVSTEDEEIVRVAKQYGAKVPFLRSKKNSDDFATTVDVLLEVLEEYKAIGRHFENVCCIYPTAPFVTGAKLIKAHAKLSDTNVDSVFPVIPYSYPIQRSLKIKKNSVEFFFPEFENARSQDLEKAYHDAGQFYFLHSRSFLESKTIFSDNARAICVNELEAQDIDNETDWKLAELKFNLIKGI